MQAPGSNRHNSHNVGNLRTCIGNSLLEDHHGRSNLGIYIVRSTVCTCHGRESWTSGVTAATRATNESGTSPSEARSTEPKRQSSPCLCKPVVHRYPYKVQAPRESVTQPDKSIRHAAASNPLDPFCLEPSCVGGAGGRLRTPTRWRCCSL